MKYRGPIEEKCHRCDHKIRPYDSYFWHEITGEIVCEMHDFNGMLDEMKAAILDNNMSAAKWNYYTDG